MNNVSNFTLNKLFETNQRNLRFKGQQAQLKQEIDRRMGLEKYHLFIMIDDISIFSEVTTMRDEIRSLQRRCKEEVQLFILTFSYIFP